MAAESCGSRGASPPPPPSAGGAAGRRRKAEAYAEVLRRIRSGAGGYGAARPGLEDELWAHFQGLPARSKTSSPLSCMCRVRYLLASTSAKF
jgi:hypothetical protein